jgi:hypothetical protein
MPDLRGIAARSSALLASFVLAGSGTPWAQEPVTPEVIPQGRHRLGPLRVTPRIEIRSGYDTNVFQTLDDPTKDAVTIVSPRLDGTWDVGRRLRLTGSGLLDINYFRRQGDERFTDFYGEGAGELLLGRVTFFGGGGGGRFTQRYSIDVDERLERQEKRAHAGTTVRLTPLLSLTARGSGEVITFAPGTFRLGGDIKRSLDRNTLTGAGEVRYKLTPFTTMVATGEVIEDRFFSQLSVEGRERRSYRYMAGVELDPRAAVTGRAVAGFRQFPGSLAEGTVDYQGPAFLADVTMPLRNFGRIRVQGARDVAFASTLVDIFPVRYRNAFVLNRIGADSTFALPGRFLAVLAASFEQSRYLLPHPYGEPLILARRVDHRYIGTAGLLRHFGPQFRAGGYVSWTRRVSSLPLFSYEAVRYGLSAEVTP